MKKSILPACVGVNGRVVKLGRAGLKPCFKILACFALSLGLVLSSSIAPAWAGETINFDGSDLSLLSHNPFSPSVKSLFPKNSFNGNKVTVSGGIISGEVFGGFMPTVATVSNNSVFIRGGEVHSVYGGFSNGSTTNNSVFISGGKVVDFIKGGDSMLGAATHNRVFISGGEVGADIYGGLSFRSDATYNSVTISGSRF